MKNRSRGIRSSIGAATVLSLIALSGCGGGSSSGDAPDAAGLEDFGLGVDLVAAAQEEGEVVLATRLGESIFGELEDTFEERYGIAVLLESPGAAEAVERVRTEARSGQEPSYDTAVLGAFALEQLAADDLLEPFVPTDFESTTLLEGESDSYFPIIANMYGIAVNTSVLGSTPAPSSWQDLADLDSAIPVLEEDPTASAGYVWFVTMLDGLDFGEPYLRSIGSNDQLKVGNVLADNISQLVRGEVGVYFPVSTFHIGADFGGTDVEFISPSEGPVVIPIFGGVVEGAQNPNAARLWLSFLWSSEGQEILAKGGQAPVRKDAQVPDPRWDLSLAEPVHQVTNTQLLEQFSVLEAGLPADLGIG